MLVSFTYYSKDIFFGNTKSHMYSWLVWTLTEATAVAGMWYGGGGVGSISFMIAAVYVFVIFIFSIFHGTKNIRIVDTISLIAALAAILVWWQLHQPLLALVAACLIDGIGYFPSYRKSFEEPWTEPLLAWGGLSLSNIFLIASLSEYNFMTTAYTVMITLLNLVLITLCLVRRLQIRKTQII